jgi:ATP-dependent Clp protease ATP-binding subunit ClpA
MPLLDKMSKLRDLPQYKAIQHRHRDLTATAERLEKEILQTARVSERDHERAQAVALATGQPPPPTSPSVNWENVQRERRVALTAAGLAGAELSRLVENESRRVLSELTGERRQLVLAQCEAARALARTVQAQRDFRARLEALDLNPSLVDWLEVCPVETIVSVAESVAQRLDGVCPAPAPLPLIPPRRKSA